MNLTFLPIRKFRIAAELETARWLDSDIADSAESASSARPFSAVPVPECIVIGLHIREVGASLQDLARSQEQLNHFLVIATRHAPLEWRKQILDMPPFNRPFRPGPHAATMAGVLHSLSRHDYSNFLMYSRSLWYPMVPSCQSH